jgi:hypothetical protein
MRLILALALLAAPAAAQEAAPAPPDAPAQVDRRTFQPPQGCTAFLTVQSAACTVSHHFTCEADPEGWQRRVDMDEEGIAYSGAIDARRSGSNPTTSSRATASSCARPRRPRLLHRADHRGRDSFDFFTNSPEFGPHPLRGPGRLIGEDGDHRRRHARAHRIPDHRLCPDGSEAGAARATNIQPRLALLPVGDSSIVVGDSSRRPTTLPVEFIFPGETRLLSVNPKHGCGMMMSALGSASGGPGLMRAAVPLAGLLLALPGQFWPNPPAIAPVSSRLRAAPPTVRCSRPPVAWSTSSPARATPRARAAAS